MQNKNFKKKLNKIERIRKAIWQYIKVHNDTGTRSIRDDKADNKRSEITVDECFTTQIFGNS